MHLEANTKPHIHQKFEIFWINIASTLACPNSKNGPKYGLRLLGVNPIGECASEILLERISSLKTLLRLMLSMETTDKTPPIGNYYIEAKIQ
jgi:methyl coenzyme M reductase beta subunit